MTPALRELLVVALFIGPPNLATGRGANHGRAPMRRPYHYRLRAHGFSIDIMVELVKAGLATTKRERMVADGRQTDVVRVRITEAGRRALAKMSQ